MVAILQYWSRECRINVLIANGFLVVIGKTKIQIKKIAYTLNQQILKRLKMLINDRFAIISSSNKIALWRRKECVIGKNELKLMLILSDNTTHSYEEISRRVFGHELDDGIKANINLLVTRLHAKTSLKIIGRNNVGYILKDKIVVFRNEDSNGNRERRKEVDTY